MTYKSFTKKALSYPFEDTEKIIHIGSNFIHRLT